MHAAWMRWVKAASLPLTVLLPIFMAAQPQLCLDVQPLRRASSLFQGVYFSDLTWPAGSAITVTFLNGSPYLREQVRRHAIQWTQHGNLQLRFVEDPQADIRITFDMGKGSWSLIGNQSRLYSVDRRSGATIEGRGGPSMNFGWFDEKTTEKEFQRTILHEFGHALGLLHEHMNPQAPIQWNKPKVYAYYLQTQGWSPEMVDANLFRKYTVDQTNGIYDPQSIMHYPISREFTLDGYEVGWNYALSTQDQALIKKLYPGNARPTEPTDPTKPIAPVSSQPYRISNLRFGDGVWSLVMSREASDHAQLWRTRTDFPQAEIEKYWEEGYDVTDLSYGNGVWALVMTQGKDYAGQTCVATPDFPEEDINSAWEEDLYITDLAYGNGEWALVFSAVPGYTDQMWVSDVEFPEDDINAGWQDGYRITDLAYGDGEWLVVMTKGSGLREQVWRTRDHFPNGEIQELWSQGYHITNLTFGDGVWALVMSKNSGYRQQSWRTRSNFPSQEIEELWKK